VAQLFSLGRLAYFMKNIFSTRKDDFAEVAANPERRRAAIDRLTGLERWYGLCSFIFMLTTLLLAYQHSFGAIILGLLAAMTLVFAAQMKSDVHLLQIMSDLHDKPSA
jgi:cell division protein FtsW (lipid II flippase)